MNIANIIFLVIVAIIMALIWVSYLRGKRPNPYKDIEARPTIPAVIIDIDMPFGSMVLFLSKIAIASIPALVIVFIVLAGLFAILSVAGLSVLNRPF